MSGDLKHPSKAIPKGTLYGLGLTFGLYTVVIVALATSISRESFYGNPNVIQLVSRLSSTNRTLMWPINSAPIRANCVTSFYR